jgi:hypothetical protein
MSALKTVTAVFAETENFQYTYYATYCWKLKLHIYVGSSEIYCFEVG